MKNVGRFGLALLFAAAILVSVLYRAQDYAAPTYPECASADFSPRDLDVVRAVLVHYSSQGTPLGLFPPPPPPPRGARVPSTPTIPLTPDQVADRMGTRIVLLQDRASLPESPGPLPASVTPCAARAISGVIARNQRCPGAHMPRLELPRYLRFIAQPGVLATAAPVAGILEFSLPAFEGFRCAAIHVSEHHPDVPGGSSYGMFVLLERRGQTWVVSGSVQTSIS